MGRARARSSELEMIIIVIITTAATIRISTTAEEARAYSQLHSRAHRQGREPGSLAMAALSSRCRHIHLLLADEMHKPSDACLGHNIRCWQWHRFLAG